MSVKWGKLALKTLGLLPIAGTKPTEAVVTLTGKPVGARLTLADGRATVEFTSDVTIGAGQELEVALEVR